MQFAYDLDGTLVDSREAVVQAYRRAGLEPPPDFWGRTAKEWNCPAEVHRRKNALYPDTLARFGRRLPLADLYDLTGGVVLTGASYEAALAAMWFLGMTVRLDRVFASCTLEVKLETLRRLGGPGLYFDDDPTTCARVREIPGWQALHAQS